MSSTKGPRLLSDFGKKAKDLLTKDYSSDQKITFSSSTASGDNTAVILRQVLEVVVGCKGISDIDQMSKIIYHNTCSDGTVRGKIILLLTTSNLKPALSKALNKILQPVHDHFKSNARAKDLLKRVKTYRVTK